RMRDHDETLRLDPELFEAPTRVLRVHDDAADRPEERKPEPRLLGRSPREHVVSGEHGRPADSRTAEPEPIEAREREPLDVHDLGRERVEPPQQAERTRPVLRALEREPRPRARVSAEQAAAG